MSDITPRRIYLDTGAFQAIQECGGFVFGEDDMPEAEDFNSRSCPQILRRPDGQEILEYLRYIFMFDQRAMFDWIVSPASLAEIDAARCEARSRYARDVMDHSSICVADNPPSLTAAEMAKLMADPRFAGISTADRKLLVEAVALECDVFLTIEKKLPKSAGAVLKRIPLLILTPSELWAMLEPHLKGL
ncbi:hypothetical protein [Rhodospirillum sp. A1_3_36]|uniref:hypothetical protein n=1 Tax=Rhodospirillum sp. A1_3_36 TaxID=3391666 RepID=UPI0039A778A1